MEREPGLHLTMHWLTLSLPLGWRGRLLLLSARRQECKEHCEAGLPPAPWVPLPSSLSHDNSNVDGNIDY